MYIEPTTVGAPPNSDYLGEDSRYYYFAVPESGTGLSGFGIKKRLKKTIKKVTKAPGKILKKAAPLLKKALPIAAVGAAAFFGGPMAALAFAGPAVSSLAKKKGMKQQDVEARLSAAMSGYTPMEQQMIAYRATPEQMEYMADFGQVPPELAEEVRGSGEEGFMGGMGGTSMAMLIAVPVVGFIAYKMFDKRKR